MPLGKPFGYGELSILLREDPGMDVVHTESWITAQVFSNAAPYNMSSARLTAAAYRRTLSFIRNLPERSRPQ